MAASPYPAFRLIIRQQFGRCRWFFLDVNQYNSRNLTEPINQIITSVLGSTNFEVRFENGTAIIFNRFQLSGIKQVVLSRESGENKKLFIYFFSETPRIEALGRDFGSVTVISMPIRRGLVAIL